MTKIDFPRRPVAFLVYFMSRLPLSQKIGILAMLIITIAVTVSYTVMFYGFKLIIDAIPQSDPNDIWANLKDPFSIVIAACIFHTVVYRLCNWIDLKTTPLIQNEMRELVMNNVMRHSHDYFHNRFSGELVGKITNLISLYRVLFWDRVFNVIMPAFVSLISSGYLLWTIDPILTGILCAVVFSLLATIYFLGGHLGRASENLANADADIAGQLVDSVTNMSSIKNYANQMQEMRLLCLKQRPYVSAFRRMVWWQMAFWMAFDVLLCGMVVAILWYIISNYTVGLYSAGSVAAALLITWDVWYRMAYMSMELTQLSGDLGRMSSALNDIVIPIAIQDKDDAIMFSPANGDIHIENLSFAYESGHRVFDGLNLSISSSQKVGIVGLSGAGKTTLCHLLMRNYDVSGGKITIGGKNIADVTQDSLRQNIAVIPQDPTLFHRSLYENILYGNPDASEADVVAAAKAAQAHDFILATPDGYQTMVGERGVKLSGGQRQRIAIARAILKDAPLLILDEATSALDSDTERLIQFALDKAMEGRTTIVVAHRLSTLAHLDRIIVMKDGQIIEDGTLQDLITANGHFAYLWKLQAGGFLPEKL